MSTNDERKTLAAQLAGELRDLATACEKAAEGDAKARQLLADYTDRYHFGLVVGAGKVESLILDP